MCSSVANTALFNQLSMLLLLNNKASIKNTYKMNLCVMPVGLRQTRERLKAIEQIRLFPELYLAISFHGSHI